MDSKRNVQILYIHPSYLISNTVHFNSTMLLYLQNHRWFKTLYTTNKIKLQQVSIQPLIDIAVLQSH